MVFTHRIASDVHVLCIPLPHATSGHGGQAFDARGSGQRRPAHGSAEEGEAHVIYGR